MRELGTELLRGFSRLVFNHAFVVAFTPTSPATVYLEFCPVKLDVFDVALLPIGVGEHNHVVLGSVLLVGLGLGFCLLAGARNARLS